jgi:ribonuclease T1
LFVKTAIEEGPVTGARFKSLKAWQFLFLGLLFSVNVFARELWWPNAIEFGSLPKEAQQTVLLIKQGGPYPYAKDGAVFGNYEGVLPKQKRGYYHEFTVQTPYARNRGARRIITGGNLTAPREFYYTDNHYATFKRIKE